MIWWFLGTCILFAVLAVGGHRHRWHRPGDDWRERQCLECERMEYLIGREWVHFPKQAPLDRGTK